MKKALLASAVCVVALGVLTAGAAGAPVNRFTDPFTFTCDHGIGTLTAIGVAQAQNTTGHVISPAAYAGAIFQVEVITFDGQVVRSRADFASQDLVNCTLTAIEGVPFTSDTVVFSGFFTPRH